MKTIFLIGILAATVPAARCLAENSSYQYIRLGSETDVSPKTAFGLALMGGGSDLDEAFRWLCNKGNGGDFLILRARGDDAYNAYVKGLCNANSVATLIVPSRSSAEEAAVSEIIRKAEVIFIAGGDQANYTRNWKGTPVQEALQDNLAAGKPIGGTSAGLAVLGEYIYSAEGDAADDAGLASPQVLLNPFTPRVALRRDFLRIDLLRNTLTDTHFAKRDRMGRTLGFLARIVTDGWSAHPKEIAVDERSAVLVDANGDARVVGTGKGAYFLSPQAKPEVCVPGEPLTFRDITVYHAPSGAQFNITRWQGTGGNTYSLDVVAGTIRSAHPNSQIY